MGHSGANRTEPAARPADRDKTANNRIIRVYINKRSKMQRGPATGDTWFYIAHRQSAALHNSTRRCHHLMANIWQRSGPGVRPWPRAEDSGTSNISTRHRGPIWGRLNALTNLRIADKPRAARYFLAPRMMRMTRFSRAKDAVLILYYGLA